MSVEQQSSPDAGPAQHPRPRRLTAAAVLAAVEGAGLAVWAVLLLVVGTRTAVMGGLTVLVLAALPLAAAYGLLRARRWSRGPAVIIQLLALPVAWTMIQTGGAIVTAGAILGVAALAELFLLLHPATTEALGGAGR